MSQFGIRLVGSKETIYTVTNHRTLREFIEWLNEVPIREITLIPSYQCKTFGVGSAHVVAVCGPNDPHAMEHCFKA